MPPAIVVEQLGKRYFVGHQRSIQADSLRDAFSQVAKAIGRRLLHPLSGPRGRSGEAGGSIEEFWALQGVSFSVEPGERIGIIGRNGAGKSTLLKILSRVVEPTSGSVRIRGRTTSLLEVGTGFHPELTGRENIFLNGAIMGMKRCDIVARFDEIVDFAEVERFLDTPVKRYSSGMYMRLAFAVAAHLEPEILIVDEVLAVGDLQFQKKCLGKMQDVSTQQGRTVLFVSHNLEAVKKLCSSALLLQEGRVVQRGTSEEVVAAYEESVSAPLRQAVVDKGVLFRLEVFDQVCPEILEAGIADGAGNAVDKLQTLGPAQLRLRFYVPEGTRNGSVGIFLATLDGRMLLRWAMSPDCGQTMVFRAGVNEVVCCIDFLPLAAGEYLLSAGLSDPPRDWLCFREMAVVTVAPGDIHGSGHPPVQPSNLVVVPCRWEVTS